MSFDSIEDLLREFETSIKQDRRIDLLKWLDKAPEHITREEAICVLLQAGCEALNFDHAWLRAQLQLEELEVTAETTIQIVRQLFAWEGEHGTAAWSAYAGYGFDPLLIDLRFASDHVCLGQSIAERFLVESKLGAGSLCSVYLVIDTSSNRRFAAKIPHRTDSAEAEQALAVKLLEEAEILKSLRGTVGIPRLELEVKLDEKIPVVVMELIDGRTLHEFFSTQPEADVVLGVCSRVAGILQAIHDQNFLHGDVKSDNVMVTSGFAPYLIDFNISRVDDPTVSEDGFPGGAFETSSPETLFGVADTTDARQDIYSLGAVLYHGLTGKIALPPAENRESAIVNAIFGGNISRPEFPDSVPAVQRETCLVAMEGEPLKRFETAGDFAVVCDGIANGKLGEMRIPPLRPLLTYWRMGYGFGNTYVQQRFVASAVDRHLQSATPEPDDFPESLKNELGRAFAVAKGIDELEKLAILVGLHMQPCEAADRYVRLVFRVKELSGHDVVDLHSACEAIDSWYDDTFQMFKKEIVKSNAVGREVFELAFGAPLSRYDQESREVWLSTENGKPFPDVLWAEFVDGLKSNVKSDDFTINLRRLNYRIVKFLRQTENPRLN